MVITSDNGGPWTVGWYPAPGEKFTPSELDGQRIAGGTLRRPRVEQGRIVCDVELDSIAPSPKKDKPMTVVTIRLEQTIDKDVIATALEEGELVIAQCCRDEKTEAYRDCRTAAVEKLQRTDVEFTTDDRTGNIDKIRHRGRPGKTRVSNED